MQEDQERVYTEKDVERYAQEQEQEQLRRDTDRWFFVKCALLLFVIFLVGGIVLSYRAIKSAPKSWSTRSISNTKQVYLVLMNFEADYGSFPDDRTAAKDPALTGFTGMHSNDDRGRSQAGGVAAGAVSQRSVPC
jgi:hypothetical protein